MNKKALGLRPYITSIVIITLFTMSILLYSLGFINLTNPTSPIVTADNRLNTSIELLNGSINSFADTSSSLSDRFQSAEPSLTDYFLIFKDGFFIIIDVFKFMVSGVFIIGNILFALFGGGIFGGIMTTVIYTITAVLLIWALFLGYKAVRTGESER